MPAAGLRAPLFDDDRDIRGAQMGPAEIVRREFSHLKIRDIVIEHYDQPESMSYMRLSHAIRSNYWAKAMGAPAPRGQEIWH